LKLLGDPDRLLAELNWVYKHSTPEHELLVARAIFLRTRDRLPISAVPVLIRPTRCHQDSDYGVFESDPESVTPATVRFSIVRIGGEIDDLASAVYNLARGET
jgi:hypothetical protein